MSSVGVAGGGGGARASAKGKAQDPPPAVYVIEWGPDSYAQRPVGSADELRAELARAASTSASVGGEVDAGSGASSRAGVATATTTSTRVLVVVHGLPVAAVAVLCGAVRLDPAFVDAHAARRRYRPVGRRGDARWVMYDYPEVVCGFEWGRREMSGGGEERRKDSGEDGKGVGRDGNRGVDGFAGKDVLADPPVKPMSASGDAAVFCRASLWQAPDVDVLFLDRPLWRDPASPLRKPIRAALVTKPAPASADGEELNVKVVRGDEVPSLEDTCCLMLRDSGRLGEGLDDVVSELAHDAWLDLFDRLGPPSASRPKHSHFLVWRLSRCLEHNLDVGRYLQQQRQRRGNALGVTAVDADWEMLLRRLSRRVELQTATALKAGGGAGPPPPYPGYNTDAGAPGRAASKWAKFNTKSPTTKDENQRGLDRVSYMGGILLPFSIVSSVLSMSDPFSPTGYLFWVFWVIAVPLVVAALFVIYADSIRKAEVWLEVSAQDALALLPHGSGGQQAGAAASPAASLAADLGKTADGELVLSEKDALTATPPATAPASVPVEADLELGEGGGEPDVGGTIGGGIAGHRLGSGDSGGGGGYRVFGRRGGPRFGAHPLTRRQLRKEGSSSGPVRQDVVYRLPAGSSGGRAEVVINMTPEVSGVGRPSTGSGGGDQEEEDGGHEDGAGGGDDAQQPPEEGEASDSDGLDVVPASEPGEDDSEQPPSSDDAAAPPDPTADPDAEPVMIVERPADGLGPARAWRREQVGWAGAVKMLFGVWKHEPRRGRWQRATSAGAGAGTGAGAGGGGGAGAGGEGEGEVAGEDRADEGGGPQGVEGAYYSRRAFGRSV